MKDEWEVGLEKYRVSFDKALEKFIKYIGSQDKLKTADDLLSKIQYTYMTSIPKYNVVQCILWRGILIDRKKYDAQLNIQLQIPTGYRIDIFVHEKGKNLNDGWVLHNENEHCLDDLFE
jgi:hypothetical protein